MRATRAALAYGEKIVYSGPILKDAKFDTGRDHHLRPRRGRARGQGGDLVGFTIAGKDGKFHPAKAEIKDDAVVVFSQQVPNPAAVRYGWVNFARPTLNLFNKEGLPASHSERTISP